ncbi:unnamed protein product [Clonostachys solani]|uniref:Uncharacterized protein n=1 Tax=Clonostachys solani TaxID=160281 RepID=A0A9N9YXP5_9HYPO|nr:unnamed protein product [Clonostachys solani]
MRWITPFLPLLGGTAIAQTFVPAPRNTTVIKSTLFEGAEISFKKTSICETTEGVNSYAGYVKIPKRLLPDASGWPEGLSANLFFWYFEARNNPATAPTSLYMGGGPGTTSFDGMSDFPCFFNHDSNSTTLNKFSWNNNVNMLYVDQPVGTGFSYVTLVNGFKDLLTREFTPVENEAELPPLNATVRQATFDPSDPITTTNNTMSVARTMWVFTQVWLKDFPKRQTNNEQLSLWAASYGGFYGPAVFHYFQEQNGLIQNNQAAALPNAKVLNLATLGLTDACVDARAMAQGYPTFAYNNTFGLEVYSKEVYELIMANITDSAEGCYGLIDRCRALAEEGDPQSFGANQTVNEACMAATNLCFFQLQGIYSQLSDRSAYDVTLSNITVVPEPYNDAFYNQRWVQEELGVPVNFTITSDMTQALFMTQVGDPMRRSLNSLERVLEGGANVALVYGDRDYRCNWFGGENVSLSLSFDSADQFRAAGYEHIKTNCSYQGGFVREHGKLSFSRIFQAGHGVGNYQPETLSKVFDRAMFKHDVATGRVNLREDAGYSSKGPGDIRNVKNQIPASVNNTCFLSQTTNSCTNEQLEALADGSAIIRDFVVVEPEGVPPVPLPIRS